MKKNGIKIILTIFALLSLFLARTIFFNEHRANQEGTIYLEIIDDNQNVLFDDSISFFEGETLFDILNRTFQLTCANRLYQPDATCSYTFQNITYQGKVILAIEHEDFTISSNWRNNFLSFEVFDGSQYIPAVQGSSTLPFHDETRIRIVLKNVRGDQS
jgi:hypothetical protein